MDTTWFLLVLRCIVFALSAATISKSRHLLSTPVPNTLTPILYVLVWSSLTLPYCLVYFPILYSRPGIEPYSHRSPVMRGGVTFIDGLVLAFQAVSVALAWQVYFMLDRLTISKHVARLQSATTVMCLFAFLVTVLLGNKKGRQHMPI